LAPVSVTSPQTKPRTPTRRGADRQAGIELLIAMVAVMWLVQLVNSFDHDALDRDGIWPHNVGRLWGILTAPFLHVSWAHLIGNTIPFVFIGLIIAMEGFRRLAAVTAIVVILGGLGTWLLSSAGTPVVGASGVVFGYATYLLARGFFSRNVLELLIGAVVVAVFGTALLSSLVPHGNVSWQGHLSGGIAGLIAAWALSADRRRGPAASGSSTRTGSALVP
jgi:membrane associated rhomboid family serine protease